MPKHDVRTYAVVWVLTKGVDAATPAAAAAKVDSLLNLRAVFDGGETMQYAGENVEYLVDCENDPDHWRSVSPRGRDYTEVKEGECPMCRAVTHSTAEG